MRSTFAGLVVAVVLAHAAKANAQNPPVTVSVDALTSRKPISPLIYGVHFAGTADLLDMNATLNRLGGDGVGRYNYLKDIDNRGGNFFFLSFPYPYAGGPLTVGGLGDNFITKTKAGGAEPYLSMPMVGYVATTDVPRSVQFDFPISTCGAQTANDVDPMDPHPDAGNGCVAGGPGVGLCSPDHPLLPPLPALCDPISLGTKNVAAGGAFQQGWMQHVKDTFGPGASTGLRYWGLDNEPSLWHNVYWDVHYTPADTDEMRTKMIDYAARIKTVDPSALVLGPEEWGWDGFFYSGKDQQAIGQGTCGFDFALNPCPDRVAHEGKEYVAYLLDQMRQADAAALRRSLDFFTLHFYPQAGEFSQDTDVQNPGVEGLRNRSTRGLWDPNYINESYINDKVRLIPRMKDWVTYYPGTKIGLTEYDWGADGHISGATAEADLLGIFGREGLDMALKWNLPDPGSPVRNAFKMYRNYDGLKSTFGETSVSASVPNPDNLAAFAAQRSNGTLTIMVVNKITGTTPTTINLANFTPTGTAQVWQLTAANNITQLANIVFAGNSFTVPALPGRSITLFLVSGSSAAANALGIDHDVTVGGMVSDRFTWQDGNGQPRVAVLAHNDGQTGPGGTRGGELREFRYEAGGATRVVSASGTGASGFGYVVSHPNDPVNRCLGGDSSNFGHFITGTFSRVFEGSHHAIFRFQQNYPRLCATDATPPAPINLPVTIDWVFSTGHDNPLWAVTYDMNGIPVNKLEDDARGPYGELLFDGAASEGAHSQITGVGWGDRYKFASTTNPVTYNSAWTWNTPNTVPYVKLWTTAVSATMGTVQTQTIVQQDAGGYFGTDRWNTTSAGGNACAADGEFGGALAHLMPCSYNWPYQSINYSMGEAGGGDNDIGTNNTRLAWGTNFGFLGQSQYHTHGSSYWGGPLPDTTAPGWPRKSYSTYVVLGRHSDSPVEAQVTQVETVQNLTLTATIGSVVTTGPAGVNRVDTITYAPAGYNPVYGALTWNASGNLLDANIAVGSGTLKKPLLIIRNYTAALPTVKLGGVTLAADVDYFPSLRAAASELWITLNRDLSGPTNHLELVGAGGGTTTANLAITKTDGQTTAMPGQIVTYTIVVTNSGPDPVMWATVTDNLPASLTGAAWTCAPAGGGSCGAGASGNINDTVNLPMGATVTYTLTGTVSANPVTLTNTATITAPGGVTDPNLSNNSATDTDALLCFGEGVIVPDGRSTSSTLAGATTAWFGAVLRLGSSYSLEFTNTTGTTPPGTLTVYAGDDGCGNGASTAVTRDTTGLDPQTSTGMVRVSFRATSGDPHFRAKLFNSSVTTVPFSFRWSDTTMFSPAWSTNGTFDTFYSFQNTTNGTVTGTLTLLDTAGATLATFNNLVVPVGQTLSTNTSSLSVTRNRTGTAKFTHDGPPGAVLATAAIANFTISPAYVQPVKFQAARESR
jgi:uncharacterized repeat protein (TIGR01451 family)